MDLIESGVSDPIKHWYYLHKFWFIQKSRSWKSDQIINLVDIGAGSALFSKELFRRGIVDKVVAVDTGYEKVLEVREGIIYCRSTDYSGFTHFLLTDVLEHVEEDGEFLASIVSQADSDAAFIISVPALMSLWSGHDVYLRHFRRYTKKQLQHVVEKSGLSEISVRYTYSTVFPIAYIQRKFAGNSSQNSQLKENVFLVRLIMRILLLPDRWIRFLPFGVSLVLEARKK
jgi:2-polyprenyl-3-methyl-5-hydroxy-6-metoxy-1,4-benzoquinol methylase